jgi:hypothetical protein
MDVYLIIESYQDNDQVVAVFDNLSEAKKQKKIYENDDIGNFFTYKIDVMKLESRAVDFDKEWEECSESVYLSSFMRQILE